MTLIQFTIGDWSQDGHNQYKEYIVNSSHSLLDVRAAYKKGVKETGIDLFKICNEYEEGTIPEEANSLFDHVDIYEGYDDEGIMPSVEEFFRAILKLIQIGNNEIEFEDLKVQCFNGFWAKESYFNDGFGYGLF